MPCYIETSLEPQRTEVFSWVHHWKYYLQDSNMSIISETLEKIAGEGGKKAHN